MSQITKRSLDDELQHQEIIAQKRANDPMVLVVKLQNTQHRTRLLKLRPAISYLQVCGYKLEAVIYMHIIDQWTVQ